MKNILLACGSGIATSTAVNYKLSAVLDDKGYKGQYRITQCKVQDVFDQAEEYDFCITTTRLDGELECPVILGTAFLTGVGLNRVVEQVLDEMEK